MLPNQTKWYLLMGVILGSLCCGFGCVNIIKDSGTKNSSEEFPIRTLAIQLDEDQREELFSQLRKFSEKHNLEFSLSFYKNKEEFFAFMDGETFEITASPRPITTTEIRINFYEKDPANPPSQAIIDELFSDLKEFITKIPNVTITEEK